MLTSRSKDLGVTSSIRRGAAAHDRRVRSALAVALIAVVCVITPGDASAATQWHTRSLGGCTIAAGINADTKNNRYYIAGYITCGAAGTRSMNCNTVHRHSVFWHSHPTVIRYSSSGDFHQNSGWLGGTNGASYKAHCNFTFDGSSLGAVESPVVAL